MKTQIVDIRFMLRGEIVVADFLEQLNKWVEASNYMLLDPSQIPDVDHIDFEVRQ